LTVEVREETLEVPTYVWGPPDPNPPFQRKGEASIYPYPLLDDLGEDARSVRYRALVVENEYLQVTVFPELGGRIFSAVDKRSGEQVFHRNTVVKPGLIGLRGAWVSGGVEWNFPRRGHTVTTLSPVDALAVQEEAGSAVIWVGDVEQMTRMSWAVGIRLRPGSAAIETEVALANRTPLPHPYYFWANVAVPARDDMRLVYPGTRAFTWGRRDMSWPVHEGKDLSRYTAFESANDVFIVDSLEDFFGIYYEERDFGLVHVADAHMCQGKKFFTWGTAHHGKVWASALTDTDGPYCEVQSGRFLTQGILRLMHPHFVERWVEWWYPVGGIGGFSWANREAAVGLARRDGHVEWSVAVTRAHPRALLRVLARGCTIHEQRADLSPDSPLRIQIAEGGKAKGEPVTLIVLDRDNVELIRHTENQKPRTRPVRLGADSEGTTPGALCQRAVRAEELTETERAWELYREALTLDPDCAPAAIALGRLAIELRPEEALERLSQAAALAPESSEAAYYLGLALVRAGREEEGEAELSRAAQRPEFAHAARVELGLMAMRGGNWDQAAEILRASLQHQPEDSRARAMLAAALRHAGRAKAAERELDAGPLDRLALAEAHFCAQALGRPRVAARCLRQLQEMLPAEPDSWLELALDYLTAGLCREASELLAWATKRVTPVRRSPLTHYLLAHLLARMGRDEEAAASRRRAAELPPDLVFPHHWELEAVLREAITCDSNDAHAHYYLGTLLYSQGRREEGLREWQAAAKGMEDHAVLQRNLGLAYREVHHDLPRAEQALRRAVKLKPDDLRLHLELDEVLRERRADPQDRLAALDEAPASVQRRGNIAARQIVCCLELQQWDRAISLLAGRTFHRWELEFRMRSIYVQAYLGRGSARFDRGELKGAREDFEQALEYPENLRIGRPPRPADARAHWCAGVACEALGQSAAARSHWEAAASESYHHPGSELHIYRALSLRKLGRGDEAEQLFGESLKLAQERAEESPDDPGVHLCLGLALRATCRDSEAEAPLRRALELNPHLHRARRLLEAETIL
jgi:tetratricopeptide (TPR) repeat protein